MVKIMNENQQSSIDSISLFNDIPNKPCYRKGCENTGNHILLISLINRIGYFCDRCKLELEKDDLIKHELSKNQFNLIGRTD
jgi:hypothetical protein